MIKFQDKKTEETITFNKASRKSVEVALPKKALKDINIFYDTDEDTKQCKEAYRKMSDHQIKWLPNLPTESPTWGPYPEYPAPIEQVAKEHEELTKVISEDAVIICHLKSPEREDVVKSTLTKGQHVLEKIRARAQIAREKMKEEMLQSSVATISAFDHLGSLNDDVTKNTDIFECVLPVPSSRQIGTKIESLPGYKGIPDLPEFLDISALRAFNLTQKEE